jgi:membrane protein YdbS with pleckstrin-like domain
MVEYFRMVSSHRLFHSYCEYPPMRFATQDGDENIVLTLRAHPVTNFPWIMITITGLLIPLIFGPLINIIPLTGIQLIFLVLVWYAFIFLFAVASFFSWYFNLGIVTTKKIIDVDVLNILNNQTTETLISRIEEVDNKNLGFLSALFNYGNVFVQTAGEEQNIEFLNIPFPSRVVQIINNLMEQQPNHE